MFLESREQALADKLSELSIWNNISSRESTFACVVEVFPSSSKTHPSSRSFNRAFASQDFSMDAKTVPSDYRFVYAKVEKEEKDKSQNSSAGNFWATFGFNSDVLLPFYSPSCANDPDCSLRLRWIRCWILASSPWRICSARMTFSAKHRRRMRISFATFTNRTP